MDTKKATGKVAFLCFIVVSYATGDLYDKGKRIANKLFSTFALSTLYYWY